MRVYSWLSTFFFFFLQAQAPGELPPGMVAKMQAAEARYREFLILDGALQQKFETLVKAAETKDMKQVRTTFTELNFLKQKWERSAERFTGAVAVTVDVPDSMRDELMSRNKLVTFNLWAGDMRENAKAISLPGDYEEIMALVRERLFPKTARTIRSRPP